SVAKEAEEPGKIFDWLAARIRAAVATGALSAVAVYSAEAAAKAGSAKADDRRRHRIATQRSVRLVEIPVCYDPEFALDIDDVARRAAISPSEVIRLHSSAEYRVACIGFVPGFPFLAGLPKELATPRRDVPRKQIPPGSVGIGGAQTGIYPLRSPGGWNLIGRTPLRLFDP